MNSKSQFEINQRIVHAHSRYGQFQSTHEALGVALEEWDEFRNAIRANDFNEIKHECYDLAAVLIRLAEAIDTSEQLLARSVK